MKTFTLASQAQPRQGDTAQTKHVDSDTGSQHLDDTRHVSVQLKSQRAMMTSSPQQKNLQALQLRMKNGIQQQALSPNFPVQRAVNVSAMQYEGNVYVEAEGQASEFKDGDDAGDYGWNGVETYMVKAKVGDTVIAPGGTFNNKFIVAQSGHILAQQNGGKGSDPNNVFAQDGGVNNGPYRTYFENPMRRALDVADEDTEVKFEAALMGDDISFGKLEKESKNLFV